MGGREGGKEKGKKGGWVRGGRGRRRGRKRGTTKPKRLWPTFFITWFSCIQIIIRLKTTEG